MGHDADPSTSCGERLQGRNTAEAQIGKTFTPWRAMRGESIEGQCAEVGEARVCEPFPIAKILFPEPFVSFGCGLVRPERGGRLHTTQSRAGDTVIDPPDCGSQRREGSHIGAVCRNIAAPGKPAVSECGCMPYQQKFSRKCSDHGCASTFGAWGIFRKSGLPVFPRK